MKMMSILTAHRLQVALLLLLCARMTNGQTPDQTDILDRIDQQLDTLTIRVASLSDILDARQQQAVDSEYTASRLARKLDEYEGKTGACRKGFYPCSPGQDGSVQCVRDYMVCDGSKDCKSGADESPSVCDRFPFKQPIRLSGLILRDTCVKTAGRPVEAAVGLPAAWEYERADVIPWFPSRPKIRWLYGNNQYSTIAQSTAYGSGHAVYDYATGAVIMDIDPAHGFFGVFTVEQVSPDKSLIRGEMHNYWSAVDDGDDYCWLSVGTLNK